MNTKSFSEAREMGIVEQRLCVNHPIVFHVVLLVVYSVKEVRLSFWSVPPTDLWPWKFFFYVAMTSSVWHALSFFIQIIRVPNYWTLWCRPARSANFEYIQMCILCSAVIKCVNVSSKSHRNVKINEFFSLNLSISQSQQTRLWSQMKTMFWSKGRRSWNWYRWEWLTVSIYHDFV